MHAHTPSLSGTRNRAPAYCSYMGTPASTRVDIQKDIIARFHDTHLADTLRSFLGNNTRGRWIRSCRQPTFLVGVLKQAASEVSTLVSLNRGRMYAFRWRAATRSCESCLLAPWCGDVDLHCTRWTQTRGVTQSAQRLSLVVPLTAGRFKLSHVSPCGAPV